MNDYYDGVEGARRLIKELDQLLQEMLDSVDHAEALDCSIKLTVSGVPRVLEGGIDNMIETLRLTDQAERLRAAGLAAG